MEDNRLIITESGFLTEFLNQHTRRTDRPFCFILGAGASKTSGIPTGAEMAHVWLRELHEAENLEGLSLDEWATAERLGIDGFRLNEAANFYPQLYQRHYGYREQAGYAFLESQMEGKEPSYGYSVLAYLLSETPHRVVITTNFDNLVVDGLSIHSSRFPLVIGHDALSQYATVELRRPLVAKIHGALGFSPKNQPDEISQLPEGWQTALARILDRYTPIVIGYGGNDGSLMGFLQALPAHIPDGVFWCVRWSGTNAADLVNHVPPSVRDYVKSRRGRFVPIRGFDELMAKLLTKLRENGTVPDLYKRLQDRHRERERSYEKQESQLFGAAVSSEPRSASKTLAATETETKSDPALTEAVNTIAESRTVKPWWAWVGEASAAVDTNAREKIYLQALEALPADPDLHRNYAGFLEYKNSEKAREHYERAIELDPRNALTLVSYADFLKWRNQPDLAEDLYQRALKVHPTYDFGLAHYGVFLQDVRKEMDKAERLYQDALRVNPDYEFVLEMYAEFLEKVRGNNAEAEKVALRLRQLKAKRNA
jgi:protein O-mannosyl-transferase